MKVLLTGGLGYIGSHTAVELIADGHKVFIVDDLSNSKIGVLERLKTITKQEIAFEKVDIGDRKAIDKVFDEQKPEAVIHFAASKAVGESVKKPLDYYQNNLGGLINLCQIMSKHGVKKLVFSSSATVYGIPESLPIKEDAPLSATNPYGQTKLMSEQILRDLAVSDDTWQITLLRYFNPFGAHSSGLIGEDPNDIPNNLMPYVALVAAGKLKEVSVFGNDWDTPDGTGVRDYIHVVDLALGHVAALNSKGRESVETYNLGSGKGYSVLEMIHAFEKASGNKIPYKIVDRRPGDIASCYADCSRAEDKLGWQTTKDLDDMCADSWRWIQYITSNS